MRVISIVVDESSKGKSVCKVIKYVKLRCLSYPPRSFLRFDLVVGLAVLAGDGHGVR